MSNIKEIWKYIEGYDKTYMISNLGQVKSLKTYKFSKKENKTIKVNRIKLLKPGKTRNGYLQVLLTKDSKHYNYRIHRLVAKAFLNNYSEKLQVNHKDGNKQNNYVDNLEMVSAKENVQHAFKNSLRSEHNNNYRKLGKENKRAIKINQVSKENGNIINTYYGCLEAERKTNICNSNIIACCKGKLKTAGGYIWRYADE